MQPSARRDYVAALIARVLRLDVALVGHDGGMNLTSKWDSMAQLTILVAIEQECGVVIEPEAAVELTSVAAIAEFLDKASA
jgi:acyl carrier protein